MTRLARASLAAVAAAVLLAAGAASAQTANIAVSATVNKTCTIVATPVAFGAYDPVAAPPDAQGGVTVTCTKGTTWSIDLGDGSHKVAAGNTTRAMSDGGTNYLHYELYFDSNRTTTWYNGVAVGANGVSNGKATTYAFPVYGKILDADPAWGAYSDTVVATVNF
jgi:spore coat protein U-like protein